MHLLTYLLLLALVTLVDTIAYSGYRAMPGVLLGGIARRVDAHCRSAGAGNFGTSGLLDWLHATTVGAQDLADDLRDEVGNSALKEKGEQGVAGVVAGLTGKGKRKGKKKA